jgi:predicted lysophospholipase L1 biosynthesis ABC-type transport system permease subunit
VVWPSVAISPAQLATLRVQDLVVRTDGSSAAIERARTVLELAVPDRFSPNTIGEFRAQGSRLIDQYQQLANVVILTSLPIAGCSLAVSVAAGLTDRKRAFSLLRLSGVPLALLRRVVALEGVVPLLVSAVVSAGAGFVAAALFLRSQLDYSLRAPGLEYYVVVGSGLVVSLAVIASTLPMLERITGPETARND